MAARAHHDDHSPSQSEFRRLIADISGYTRFMLKNHTATAHAHGMADLIAAVVVEVQLPLEVNTFEGDAIFMIAERRERDWDVIGCDIRYFLARTRHPRG